MTNINYENVLIYEFDDNYEYSTYIEKYKNEYVGKQVIWSKGNDYRDLFIKAKNLFEQNQHEKALKTLETAMEFNPIGLKARFLAVDCLAALKRFDEAKEKLFKIKDMLPDNGYARLFYRKLGYIFSDDNQFEAACACQAKSLEYEKADWDDDINSLLAEFAIKTNMDIEDVLKKNNIPILPKKHMTQNSGFSPGSDLFGGKSRQSFYNNNKYMFVCSNCLETYSSDSQKAQRCKNCGNTLIKIPISVFDWRKMNDKQKEEYKNSFLNPNKMNTKSFYGSASANSGKQKDHLYASLSKLNNAMFPNNCRNHIEKQMRYLIGDSIPDDEYIKIYVYCMTHYLVNGEKYGYVVKMLPLAHPELKDKETIKLVAAYTFLCSTGNPDKIDLFNKDAYNLLEITADALDSQNAAVERNANKNKEPFDEERGTVREKPMYFAGVRNAEQYLNSLSDLDGNKLHIDSTRFTYKIDGIPEILDNYQMMREDGTKYGDLYVSIYGKDNYPYVPKGYKHPTLRNPEESSNLKSTAKASKNVTTESSQINQKPQKNNETPFSANNKESEIKPSSFSEEKISAKERANASTGIKFCRKCGTELMPGTRFCRKCGTKIEL